jgi:hydrogenase expression/formation protein HypE
MVDALAPGAEMHIADPTAADWLRRQRDRQSGVSITLEEESIPVRPAVASACELLGFDPLYVANEGRLIVIAAERSAVEVLAALRDHPLGRGAQRIGRVEATPPGRVRLHTRLGTARVIEMLSGEMLPRIC